LWHGLYIDPYGGKLMTPLESFLAEVKAANVAIRQEVANCEYCDGALNPLCNSHQIIADFHARTYIPTMARVIEVLIARVQHQDFCRKTAVGDTMRELGIRNAIPQDICNCGLDLAIAAALAGSEGGGE
jgi:hypothetical protein